jgi:hypothetical protein
MHPELEDFLEEAFAGVKPTASGIGQVVVEPDYDVAPEPKDAGHLVSELLQCLSEVDTSGVKDAGQKGAELEIPGAYRLLKRYIRRITLHPDKIESEWVEVAPPGNWI